MSGRLTPFGVIDRYFYSGDDNGGPVLGWSSFHAQRVLELLAAEGYVVIPASLLDDLTDPDPCSWDHEHSCQAHGYFYIPQDSVCPVEAAKRVLAAEGVSR